MFYETKDVQTYEWKDVLRDQDVQTYEWKDALRDQDVRTAGLVGCSPRPRCPDGWIGRMFSETKMFGWLDW